MGLLRRVARRQFPSGAGKPFVGINRQKVGGGGSVGRMSVENKLVKDHANNVDADDAQQRDHYVNKESLALAQPFEAAESSFEKMTFRFLCHRQPILALTDEH